MPNPNRTHPFLTERGLRLQQLGRLDQIVPRAMPESVPAMPSGSQPGGGQSGDRGRGDSRPGDLRPGDSRPGDSQPSEPGFVLPRWDRSTSEVAALSNVRPTRKHPSPLRLADRPLDDLYRVRRLRPGGNDPLRAIGKLFIQPDGGAGTSLASGSAWIIGPSTIATAAHNLYDSNERTWSRGLMFFPDFNYYRDFVGVGDDGADTPTEPIRCGITGGYIPRRYLENPTTDADIAVCYTDVNIGDIVGATIDWQPVDDIEFYESRPIAITGYPAGSGFDFGKQMWRSVGDMLFSRRSAPWSDPAPVMATSFGSGASGGPWLVPAGDGRYAAVGLTSGHAKLQYAQGEHSLESLMSPMISGRLIDELQSDAVVHEFANVMDSLT